ncbi:MAG: adenosine deaminase [Clostridia bacterium]|nr:adenosine deaminase [Clostridia bacterium]
MIDLHLHLDGSLEAAEIIELAKKSKVDLPTTHTEELKKLLTAPYDCKSLGEYLERFDLPLKVLQSEGALEQAVYNLLKRLAKDGLCYAEIRFAPQLHTEKLSQEQAVCAAVKGLETAQKNFKISAQLILCCMRGDNNCEANMETVKIAKKYLGRGVCAIDLAGNEASFPTRNFAHVLKMAAEQNIPVTIHAGEGAGAQSVKDALELGAARIGHGVRSVSDLDLIKALREKKIPLEMCFTSNLQTKAVSNTKSYPLKFFMDNHLCVTINTDNMTVSNTTLRREYISLQKEFKLSYEQLKSLALKSADAAFLPKEEKAALKEKVEREFVSWLNSEDRGGI